MAGRQLTSLEFKILPRSVGAKELVPIILNASHEFRTHYQHQDQRGMEESSVKAWRAMTRLFDVLRNEQDHGKPIGNHMLAPTGILASNVTLTEQAAMVQAARVYRQHASCCVLSLRDALNKIAHYDTNKSSFRLDRRGAHYLVLGGMQGHKLWVSEILVSRLCKNARSAVQALR